MSLEEPLEVPKEAINQNYIEDSLPIEKFPANREFPAS